MAQTNNNGEATPQTNTANQVKINPLEFPEEALAKILSSHLDEKESETQAPAAEEAEDKQTENQDSETKPDVTEDDSEVEAPSQSDEVLETEVTEEDRPTGVQKRIDKLTARAKEAEERAEAALRESEAIKQRLQELEDKASEKSVSPIKAENPLSDIWDFNKLKQEKEKADYWEEWCEDHPDGAEVNGVEYTAEQVKALKRGVRKALKTYIPERVAFLQQYYAAKPQVEADYPFWKDTRSPEYVEAQQILSVLPQLKSHPEYQVWIGDALEGRKARLAKQSQQKKASTVTKVAPKQPAQSKSMPARASGDVEAKAALRKSFLSTGGEDELAKTLESSLSFLR